MALVLMILRADNMGKHNKWAILISPTHLKIMSSHVTIARGSICVPGCPLPKGSQVPMSFCWPWRHHQGIREWDIQNTGQMISQEASILIKSAKRLNKGKLSLNKRWTAGNFTENFWLFRLLLALYEKGYWLKSAPLPNYKLKLKPIVPHNGLS